MLMPSIFGDVLLDDFFGTPAKETYHRPVNANSLMQTDIKEFEDAYQVTMNLPGYQKEDVKGEVKDGYLVITAQTSSAQDQKEQGGRYIRRERYSGSCSRSFYVGEQITEQDIKAKFENGTLKLTIPKKDPAKQVEQNRFISIEG